MRDTIDTIDTQAYGAYQKTKETGDIYGISQYASEKPEEFYTECFAAHMIGEKLSDYIEKMLKTPFKK